MLFRAEMPSPHWVILILWMWRSQIRMWQRMRPKFMCDDYAAPASAPTPPGGYIVESSSWSLGRVVSDQPGRRRTTMMMVVVWLAGPHYISLSTAPTPPLLGFSYLGPSSVVAVWPPATAQSSDYSSSPPDQAAEMAGRPTRPHLSGCR